eukprot:TRINITY_DN25731_c0_g1_i1.p1 TRINITY_DN25731_c0_g1~~TRINITY_DN25731_c0_g1_i1.p1  ORF type:complete len:255 (+),score=41.71 TRINITY_DN25731_c0_g1_i1:229-993(+)
MALPPAADFDWARIDSYQAEFENRHHRRQLRYLARFKGLRADGSTPEPRPWAPLGTSKADPNRVDSGGVSEATRQLSCTSSGYVGRGCGTPFPSKRRAVGSEALSGDQRTPFLAGAEAVMADVYPPNSSSGPPRTGSTTLSTIWRRAVSTPSLNADAGRNCLSKEEEEEWNKASAHLAPEEMARLIEHVHRRVVKERRRRKDAEADLRKSRSESAGNSRRLTSGSSHASIDVSVNKGYGDSPLSPLDLARMQKY